jgi:hypothetical protein
MGSARISSPEIEESGEQRKNRLNAFLDTDCAFSANYEWCSKLKTVYEMDKGYLVINRVVDLDGNSVLDPFEDQEDICQLVTAMVAGGK